MILAEITFSSPIVLIGLLFAIIPLILHLFGRTRAKTVKFPMTRFVQQAALKTYHRRKIENIALLLARIAMMSFIPLALALPFYRSSKIKFSSKGHLALAIIIDNTASMRQLLTQQQLPAQRQLLKQNHLQFENKLATAFERAKINALRLIRGSEQMPAPALAILITPIGKYNRNPIVSTNLSELAKIIRKMKCTDAETDITTTIIQAQKLIKSQPYANKLIYVLSDCQKTKLDIDQLTTLTDANIPIVILKTTSEKRNPQNVGITRVKFSAPLIANKPLAIKISLQGNLSTDKTAEIQFNDNDNNSICSENIVIPAQKNFSKTYSLNFTPQASRYLVGKITLKLHDDLTTDNKYYITAEISEPIQAILVTDSKKYSEWAQDPSFFVISALKASSWIRTEKIPITQLKRKLPNNNVNAIYLCQTTKLASDTINAITQYLHSGNKNLIIFPDFENTNALSNLLQQLRIGKLIRIVKTDTPRKITDIDSADKLISSLGVKTSIFYKIAISEYAHIVPYDNASSILTLSTTHPLLIRKSIYDSNIYLFTSPARIDTGTLPLSPAFPAIICNIAAETVTKTHNFTFLAGIPFNIKTNKPEKITNKNNDIICNLKKGRNECLIYNAGLYNINNQKPIAINYHPDAIDIQSLSTKQINSKNPTNKMLFASCLSSQIEQHLLKLAKGTPLWNYILLLTLIIMLAETLLANLRKSPSSSSTQI